jgi:uncharacterized protein (DUF1330 family)
MEMAAYLIARVNVINWEKYKDYVEATPSVIQKFGGSFLARGGKTATVEGPEEDRRVVLVEFPTFEKAVEFYSSKEYQEAKSFREGAATVSTIVIDGV